jgi:hypothetical protein
MSTNLIDTYVSEVGRRLPKKTRTDIENEIRSTLQDMLEERSRNTGKPVDEERTLEVLKAYGAPEKVAANYMGERSLIGPQLYPVFLLVIRIIFPIIAILAGISAVVNISQHVSSVENVFGAIVSAFAGVVTAAISALGSIVIIFAIIEWALFRAGGKVDLKGLPQEKEWDPRSLTRISTPNQVKVGETIIEVVGCFIIIIIFNFYPQIIGFTPNLNGVVESGNWAIGFGSATFTPLFNETFFHYVPYMTLVWALTIILDIVLLRMGHWNVVTRICLIGLKIVNIIIAAAMLAVPSLLAITSASLTPALGDPEGARILMNLLTQFIRVALWVTILGNGIEILKAASRLVTNDLIPQITGKS